MCLQAGRGQCVSTGHARAHLPCIARQSRPACASHRRTYAPCGTAARLTRSRTPRLNLCVFACLRVCSAVPSALPLSRRGRRRTALCVTGARGSTSSPSCATRCPPSRSVTVLVHVGAPALFGRRGWPASRCCWAWPHSRTIHAMDGAWMTARAASLKSRKPLGPVGRRPDGESCGVPGLTVQWALASQSVGLTCMESFGARGRTV